MDVLTAAERVRSAHRAAVRELEAVVLGPTEWWSPSSPPIGYRAAWLYLEMDRILARWDRQETNEMETVRELLALLEP
jgi:hypothetical protein